MIGLDLFTNENIVTFSIYTFALGFSVYLESYVQSNLILWQDSDNSFGTLLDESIRPIASTQRKYSLLASLLKLTVEHDRQLER